MESCHSESILVLLVAFELSWVATVTCDFFYSLKIFAIIFFRLIKIRNYNRDTSFVNGAFNLYF